MNNIKVRLILVLVALGSWIVGIILTLKWYDWKFLVLILIFMFAQNIDNHLKLTRATTLKQDELFNVVKPKDSKKKSLFQERLEKMVAESNKIK